MSLEKGRLPMSDNIKQPRHYTWHPTGVEHIATVREPMFCMKTAWTYLWRCEHKGQFEDDVSKALLYLKWAEEEDPEEWMKVADALGYWYWSLPNPEHTKFYEPFRFEEAMKLMTYAAYNASLRVIYDAIEDITLARQSIIKEANLVTTNLGD